MSQRAFIVRGRPAETSTQSAIASKKASERQRKASEMQRKDHRLLHTQGKAIGLEQ